MKTLQDIKPGEHFIGVTQGMRGWFACEFWLNNTDFPETTFFEPWQSDDSSFATKEEAAVWAKELADLQELPCVE